MATITFQGIYSAVKSFDPTGFYGSETSRILINITPLATTATFTQPGNAFSGNNVLGTVAYGEVSFTALVSRPFKVGGVVKGFYAWVDNEGVWTGKGTDLDTAYILSLDNTYFNANAQITSSSDKVATALTATLNTQSKEQIPEFPEEEQSETEDFLEEGFPEIIITVDEDIDPHEIDVIAPDGTELDEETYRIEEIPDSDPETNTFRVILEDSDPETPGDQPFGSIYEEFLQDNPSGRADDYQGDGSFTLTADDLEISSLTVDSESMPRSQRLACLEALFSLDPPQSTNIDIITGSAEPRVYELGDSEKAFYGYQGDQDFALIKNYKSSDTLQLHGKGSDYTLSNPITVAGETGFGLRYKGELVALLQGSNTDLQNLQNSFQNNFYSESLIYF